MTESKHTPGPWRAQDDLPEPYWQIITDDGLLALATVIPIDIGSEADVETRARAHLIAAAPEMFEALALFEKQWNACGPNSDFGRYFQNVRNAAVAALAKARGERP